MIYLLNFDKILLSDRIFDREDLYSSLLSACGASWVGKLYSSLAQAPRSIILQRSEQKGRNSLSSHVVSLPQRGQFKVVGMGRLQRKIKVRLGKYSRAC
jgi:hypothetical protein